MSIINAKFDAEFESKEKMQKIRPKEVIGQNFYKSPFLVNFFADNFFLMSLYATFWIQNQHQILHFYSHISFMKNIFIFTTLTFIANFAVKRLKITKNVFCKCLFELNFATRGAKL